MSDYTPTTSDVRAEYVDRCMDAYDRQVARDEFDRWLAAHDAEVRAGVVAEEPEPSAERTLTPCGNLVCTGCGVCGCPALGIAPASRKPQGVPSDAGEGWFEWFEMPENTSEIAYVYENGDVFDPARGWNPVEFTIAAAEGRVHRLVRAVTEQEQN